MIAWHLEHLMQMTEEDAATWACALGRALRTRGTGASVWFETSLDSDAHDACLMARAQRDHSIYGFFDPLGELVPVRCFRLNGTTFVPYFA
jgi:hypothetical protein